MRISSLTLTNFKRFTHLVIGGLPESAKLVLLIGSNGSGKSSVFDAFNRFRSAWGAVGGQLPDEQYYMKRKNLPSEIVLSLHGGTVLSCGAVNGASPIDDFMFYGRPSVRVVPEMQRARDVQDHIKKDLDYATRFVAFDTRFFSDIAEFTGTIDKALREPTFEGRAADTVAIFRRYIEPLNEALRRIFGENPSTVIQIKNYNNSDPSQPVQVFFSKGESTVPYDLLSFGEKQVVILLMNFVVRRDYYQDTIYFIDEMDLHLNTSLQKTVLGEVIKHWIPDNSQLWTASHALGFIEYANESEQAVIIDFDDFDFDQSQELVPSPKQSINVFEIAVPRDSLTRLFAGRKIIACEGKDDILYNAACDDASRIFVPAGNAAQVFAMISANPALFGLRDRDYLLEEEVSLLGRLYPNYRSLPFYSIESLLYHPANIASLGPIGYDEETWREAIRTSKKERPLRDVRYPRSHIAELRAVPEFQRKRPPAWEADPKEIYDAYESSDFDIFYPVVAIKNFPKTYLEPFGLTQLALARAPWFVAKLKELTA